MKQTAMQEHIEWLKATIEIAQEQTPILVNVLKLCLNDATQRLEMEKEQIIDAYNNGDNRSAELYYNETFKTYCMPEGLDTPEKHEQYLKDIGLINK